MARSTVSSLEEATGLYIQSLISEQFGEVLIKKGHETLLNDTGELTVRLSDDGDTLQILFYENGEDRFICELELWIMLEDTLIIKTDAGDTIIDFRINNDIYHIEVFTAGYSGGCASVSEI